MRVLGVIPARAGSKSIKGKNYVELAGRPLIDYVIQAGKASRKLDRLCCLTNDPVVFDICTKRDVEFVVRSQENARDNANVVDAVKEIHFLYNFDAVALLQPTSPGIDGGIIDYAITRLAESDAASVQTIHEIPHNYHAYNQRTVENGKVSFLFRRKRKRMFNKQQKPKLYAFGNLVITRTEFLKNTMFAEPSIPIMISRNRSFDVDTRQDLDELNWLGKTLKN